jgi:hypothetical protein
MNQSNKTAVIPDIHGRIFWEDVIPRKDEFEYIVFLGDYTDPYSHEGISPRQVVENFEGILKFKESSDKVILLIGNHDFQYLYGVNWSRYDHRYRDLFIENSDKFQMAFQYDKYLFTHAGVGDGFRSTYLDHISGDNWSCKLNHLHKVSPTTFRVIGPYRGGWNLFSSPIWRDVREGLDLDYLEDGTVQIFGHTQLRNDPILGNYMNCLDCRKVFILDTGTGDISELNNIQQTTNL